MKTAATLDEKNAVIDLIDRLTAAAGPGYTRGDLAAMARAARNHLPYLNVVRVLDPNNTAAVVDVSARARAVIDAAEAADLATIEFL
jgi:hypothetical protein